MARTILLVLAIAALGATSLSEQVAEERRRILLLFTHESHLPAQIILERAIRSTLQTGSGAPLEIYSEYLDAVRTPVGDYEKELVMQLGRKYGSKKFDLIFAINPPALRILLNNQPPLLPDTPIVFLVLEPSNLTGLNLVSNVTGVWGENNYESNLALALALHPGTKQVVVISGVSEWDKYWRARVQKEFRAFEGRIELSYLIGLTISEQQKALAGLPHQTIVFFVSSTQDNAGNNYSNLEVIDQVSPASSAPIYGTSDAQLGYGIIGGRFMSFESLGVAGARVGLRVLAGEKPEAIAPHGVPSVPMFDWRELKRWGISESSLPPGSIVRFRVPTFWDEYKWHAIALISVILVQSALIVGLVINRTRRKRAEQSLRRTEQRNRDIVRAQPDLMFINASDGVYLDYHANDIKDLFVPSEQFLGKNIRDVFHAELAEAFFDCFRRAKQGRELQVLKYSLPMHGELRWYEVRVIYTDADQFLSIVRDITEAKRAEEALCESEERYRQLFEQNIDGVFVATRDGCYVDVSPSGCQMLGMTREEVLGSTFLDVLVPEEHHRIPEAVALFADGKVHYSEWRFRRKDGSEFIGELAGCELADGRLQGIVRDITERKAAEQALKSLSGQLIQAREDECARIARELHDDLNQRMAIISIELEQLGQSLPDTDGQLRSHLQDMLKQIAEVSHGIHQISHDLHPSKLNQLGLVATVKSLCNDLGKSHNLKIELFHEDVPNDIPKVISLCLYRVVQECLNNVIKHSGAREVKVELRGTAKEIRLRVSDSGIGFDIESPEVKHGLGLVSMRERLRLVGGHITMVSHPSQGTQIEATVPLGRAGLGYESASPDGRMRIARG